ncbi:hypothetical protein CapIbe_021798 [Capra ibex]
MGSGDLDPGGDGLLMGFMSLGICRKAANSQASVDADTATRVRGFPDLGLRGLWKPWPSRLVSHLVLVQKASASLCSDISPSPAPADHILESRDRKGGIP